ncbi:MAG: hemerythrin domain-containing protein [Novosphingobium sp.]
MSEAISVLRHEHDAILMALSILDRIAEKVRQDDAEPGDVASFLGFLRDFADTCHHGKEEGLLFPAMIAAGLPAESGPVAVMLAEHAEGRDMIAAMRAASEPTLDSARFSDAAAHYAAHMRQHIDKENAVLFPMAEQIIPAATLDALASGFEEHEEKVMGHGRHEELHAMLHDLKARYGA